LFEVWSPIPELREALEVFLAFEETEPSHGWFSDGSETIIFFGKILILST
jgi:hypothetical protein